MADIVTGVREAAAALGVPKSTLARLLHREPAMAASIVSPPQARTLSIDLNQLRTAWESLQGPPASGDSSPRERHRRELLIRLHWQAQALHLEAEHLEAEHAAAGDARDAERAVREALQRHLHRWAAAAAQNVIGMAPRDAEIQLEVSLKEALARFQPPRPRRHCKQPPPPIAQPAPDPLPDDATLRSQIEHERGRLHQLKAHVATGQWVPVDPLRRRVANDARLIRDAVLRIPQRISWEAPSWRTPADASRALRAEIKDAMSCCPARTAA